MTKDQPIEHVRLGTIQAAIWRNQDREGSVRFNTTFERLYRDDKNEWQSTNSFGRDELLIVAKVADLANTKVHELISTERKLNRPRDGGRDRDDAPTRPKGSPSPAGGATAAANAAAANAR